MKTGVLLFNLGGPDSLEAVKPFLYNLFADNAIIQLPVPQLLQNLFAWRVSNKREKESQANYRLIGGKSPILEHTQAQADLLRQRLAQLGHDVSVYIAMRYWHPFCGDTLKQMQADGVERIILLPLYPHYSLATTGSSLQDYQRQKQRLGISFAQESTVCAYYDEPLYLEALAETIQRGLRDNDWGVQTQNVRILFSAHGLPVSYVKKNRDPYPRQIQQSAMRLMARHFPKNPWQLCYQSRVGPLQWLTPYTEELLAHMARKRHDNLLVVPISFVSDHIETLYELDLLYILQAREAGLQHVHRAPALNGSPIFIETLAQLSVRALEQPNLCRIRLPHELKEAKLEPSTSCTSTLTPDTEFTRQLLSESLPQA